MTYVRRVNYWWPVFMWMAVIFYFSSRERVTLAQEYVINFLIFKTFHVLEYGVLYLLSYRAFQKSRPIIDNSFLAAFILTVFYALTDEIHQIFVPTREGRLRDVIIDATGGLIAWYFLKHLLPKAPAKLRSLAKKLGLV